MLNTEVQFENIVCRVYVCVCVFSVIRKRAISNSSCIMMKIKSVLYYIIYLRKKQSMEVTIAEIFGVRF